jgi:hypothetical protein
MTDALDMFGMPILARRGPGRPRHEPSAELRQRVAGLRADGAPLIDIAAAIGISVPTLVLHYRSETGSRAIGRRLASGAQPPGVGQKFGATPSDDRWSVKFVCARNS